MNTLAKIIEEIESDKQYSLPIDASVNHNYREGYVAGMTLAQEIIREHLNDDGWILIEDKLPDDGALVLISFENFPFPLTGRYKEDDTGGAFYVGEDKQSCASHCIFVTAWQPLPEPFKENNHKH